MDAGDFVPDSVTNNECGLHLAEDGIVELRPNRGV
jgi:hypothetical protein